MELDQDVELKKTQQATIYIVGVKTKIIVVLPYDLLQFVWLYDCMPLHHAALIVWYNISIVKTRSRATNHKAPEPKKDSRMVRPDTLGWTT